VQPLCEVLNNAEHDKEILELITRTQRLICENPPEEEKTGQTPEIHYNAHVQLRVQQNWFVNFLYLYPVLGRAQDASSLWPLKHLGH
jgi:hypothetical protein